jgi:hypothetical protein
MNLELWWICRPKDNLNTRIRRHCEDNHRWNKGYFLGLVVHIELHHGIPLDNLDEGGYTSRPRDEGVLERVMKFAKKMIGREDYEEVRTQEEGLGERARRQKETPSSIYAHKTVEVSYLHYPRVTLTTRTQYGISKHTLRKDFRLQLYQLW